MRRVAFAIACCFAILDPAIAIQAPGTSYRLLDRGRYLHTPDHDSRDESLNIIPDSNLRILLKRGSSNSRSTSTVRPQGAPSSPTGTSQPQPAARKRSRSPTRNDSSSGSQSSGRSYKSARSRSSSPQSSISRSSTSTSASTSSSGWSSRSSDSQSSGRTTSSGTSGTTSDSGPSRYSVDSRGEARWPHNIMPPTEAGIHSRGPAIIGSRTTGEVSPPTMVHRQQISEKTAINPFKSKVFGASFAGGDSRAVAMGDVAKARVRTGASGRGYVKSFGQDGERVFYVGPNSHAQIRVESEMPGLEQVLAEAMLRGEGTLRAKGRNFRRRALTEATEIVSWM